MTIYTLYVKTHKITGLKYLGQTTKNPYTYKGSGIDWKKHICEHGNDLITEILYQGPDREEMKRSGRYYSTLWNVKDSSDWANRIPETGGGSTPDEETRQRLREKQIGRKKPPRTVEHKKKLGDSTRGKSNSKTSEGLKKWYSTNPDRKNAIEKQSNSLKEWYKNNPEKAKEKSQKRSEYYKTNPEKLKEKNQKISHSKILNQRDRYMKIVPLILKGQPKHEISNQSGYVVKNSEIEKIKDGSHRVFQVFPELVEFM